MFSSISRFDAAKLPAVHRSVVWQGARISVVAAAVVCVNAAAAQVSGPAYVVMPAAAGALTPDHARTVEQVEAVMRTAGAATLDRSHALDGVRQKLRTVPFRPVPDDLRSMLAEYDDRVLRQVALLRTRTAIRTAKGVLERAQPHLAAIGRDAALAQHTLNLCLHELRARMLEHDDRNALQTHALGCASLFPGAAPDESTHPADVRKMYDDAVRTIHDPKRAARLVIRPYAPAPDECSIRVNGRVVGQTPAADILVPGGSYAVQIECDANRANALVLVSAVPGETSTVVVDHELTQAMAAAASGYATTRSATDPQASSADHDAPVLGLEYSDESSLNRLHVRHGIVLARASGGERAILVQVDSKQIVLTRADVVADSHQGLRARVATRVVPRANMTSNDGELDRAVRALLTLPAVAPQGAATRMTEVHLSTPMPHARGAQGPRAESAELDASSGGSTRWLGAAAMLSSALGVAGYAMGWVSWLRFKGARDTALKFGASSEAYAAAADDRGDFSRMSIIGGAAGAVLTTSALVYLLPDAESTPALAYATGAVGLGLAGAGALFWATNDPCDGSSCDGDKRNVPLAPLLMAQAVPFIAVPITYWLRPKTQSDAPTLAPRIGFNANPRGGMATLSGRF